jgi:anti-anti-sigma factor
LSLPPHFEITSTKIGTTRSLKVVGELDSATSHALAEEFEQAVAQRDFGEITLDLEEVSFVDSAGLREMILLEQRAEREGIPLLVLRPPSHLTELLRVSGLSDRFRVADAEEGPRAGVPFVERIELELPCDPHAPARARAELRQAAHGRLEDADLDAATLLASEIVTNAVIHADSPEGATIGLRMTTFADGIRVEVVDSGKGFDPATSIGATERGGRGLMVVNCCATRWGARLEPTEQRPRFCVWFEMDAARDSVPVAAAER